MGLTLVTAPTKEPIDIEDAKTHLRVDGSPDDGYIKNLILAARQQYENDTGKALVTQTWDWVLDRFPVDVFEVPKPPLASVTSVTYIDTNGTSQTFSSSKYIVDTDSEQGRIALADGESWPDSQNIINAVTVRFIAGHGAPGDVPQSDKHAIRFLVSHWFESREPIVVGASVNTIPMAYESLVWGNRVLRF